MWVAKVRGQHNEVCLTAAVLENLVNIRARLCRLVVGDVSSVVRAHWELECPIWMGDVGPPSRSQVLPLDAVKKCQ